jgi:type II secretory pathway pseudopilin PulG
MTVAAIIVILASIVYPALMQSRRSAWTASAVSNMHQCGVALNLYSEDYGGGASGYPVYSEAISVLKSMPTCDHADTWRSGCSEGFVKPMIGSFAYARGVAPLDEPDGWRLHSMRANPAVMANIFHASTIPSRFVHDQHPAVFCAMHEESCNMPNRVLWLYLDGAVRFAPQTTSLQKGTHLYITWGSLFFLGE